MLSSNALSPTAVLSYPVVFAVSELYPTAVLLSPVVMASTVVPKPMFLPARTRS